MISLILFLRSDLHGKVTNRSCWHWINMQEAIVQVILESLKHSVWLSLSSIVHITCPLFVITLLSRFSRKTVSCSFLRTRTAWSSRARLSRANDGITSSCSPNLLEATHDILWYEKNSNDFIYDLSPFPTNYYEYVITILSYPSSRAELSIFSFLCLSVILSNLEEEEGSNERASARKIKATPFGETTTRRL